VECAIVYPLTFLLLLGILVGAIAVFRYQEVASLARQGARYASTHGAQFRKDTGLSSNGNPGSPGTQASPTTANGFLMYQASTTVGANTSWSQTIYDNAVAPNLVALDTSALNCRVGWTPVINLPNNPDNWPGSTVSVTVSYTITPEFPFLNPITVSSTSTMQITN